MALKATSILVGVFGVAIFVCVQSSVLKPIHTVEDGYTSNKRSTRDESSTVIKNNTDTSNKPAGHHVNGTHKKAVPHKHHTMHVASLNFEHVKSPFIIAVFLLTAGIAKLGEPFFLYF